MPRILLNGTPIHYQQQGQGPDLVLIHGLFSNIAFWWTQAAPLLAGRFRVTALDLRGHGFSGMPATGYRASDLAGDILALMDHLEIDGAHLVGHSFGGAIALAGAMDWPDRVDRITLADAWIPSLQAQAPLPQRTHWPVLQRRLRARGIVIETALPRVAMGFLEEIRDAPAALGASGISGVPVAASGARPPRAVRRWTELMARTQAWSEFHADETLAPKRLETIERPVKLVYGARSRYHESRDALARILPDRRMHEVAGGHFFPLFHPEALAGVILEAPGRAPAAQILV